MNWKNVFAEYADRITKQARKKGRKKKRRVLIKIEYLLWNISSIVRVVRYIIHSVCV